MSAGKGMTPRKGYNYQAYADNYDQIFRKSTKPKRLKTMKTNQDGTEATPDATATPRTAEIVAALREHASGWFLFKCSEENCLTTIVDVFTEIRTDLENPNGDFAKGCESILERELAAAKAEIAQISTHTLAANNAAAALMAEREKLQADNAQLRAEVERLKDGLLTAHSAKREYLARIETIGDALCGTGRPRSHTDILAKANQLRARVAELERQSAEAVADKARLDWLEKSFNDDPIAKVPTWFSVFCDVAQEEPHTAPGQSLRAAIDAARAEKGAT